MDQAARRARQAAVAIVRVLRGAGHVAYLAGGCVRDELLGLEPKDYDVATGALPEAVCRLFTASRKVGEAFGVVLVRRGGLWTEVATFRQDMEYVDGRRPQSVRFTDARHDAERRDFTINGLFEDPLAADPDQQIIDYVGGLDDLRRRRVRAIGDPQRRFAEDYLRMLRAVRFAARLGFTIDRRTVAAILAHAGKLAAISRERIGQEVAWMLLGPGPARAVEMIQRLRLDAAVLREENWQRRVGVLRRTARLLAVAAYPAQSSTVPAPVGPPNGRYAVLLAAWLLDRHWQCWWERHTSEKPDPSSLKAFTAHVLAVAKAWRAALCLTNEQFEAMRQMLRLLADAAHWRDMPVAKRKRVLAQPDWPGAWVLLRAMSAVLKTDQPAAGVNWRSVAAALRRQSPRLFAQGVAPRPLVTGDDLIALGIKPGPAMGRLLEELYDVQLEGRLRTKAQALAAARQHA